MFSFPHLGIDKLKHTIEPEVQYLYVPRVGKSIVDNFALPTCAELEARGITPQRGSNCDATLFSEGFLFDALSLLFRASVALSEADTTA